MNQLNYLETNPTITTESTRTGSSKRSQSGIWLIAFVIALELLTPFFIWKGVLPSATRWISDAIVAGIIALLFIRMVAIDHIPGALWVVAGFTAVGVAVAIFNRQDIFTTLWGVWLTFRYPLVGVYMYLHSPWPERFPQRLQVICLSVLTFEVIVQIGQYLTGESLGDNLAGTFGWKGHEKLVLFIAFTLCLALGSWIVRRDWKPVVYVLALGAMASVLGEMKFFPVVAFALAGFGFLLYVMKGGQIVRLVPYVIFLGIVVLVFIVGYNTFVPGADEKPLESFILDPNVLSDYTNQLHRSDVESGVYIMGRTRALKYGWSTINRDPITLLIGFGLGARSESVALGSEGIAFQLALRRYTARSSLLVFMQEVGVLGLLAIATVILWIAVTLFRGIKHDLDSPITELRYALLLFTLFLPIWFWYSTTNMYAVTMLLYWMSLGYVLGESYRQSKAGYKSYLENSPFIKREHPAL